MKRLFSTSYNKKLVEIWVLVLRILVGVMMLTHALPKFNLLISGGEINFPDPIGLGSGLSFFLIVFAEFVCSIFIIVGLGTRLSTIPLIFAMFVAAFVFHAGDPFASKEMAILYLLIYLTLLFTGGGKVSVDYLMQKAIRKNKK